MRRDRAIALLEQVAAGQLSIDAALRQLDAAPVEEIGVASVDTHRALRQGYPEVVFGEGKTPEQIVAICERLAAHGDGFLVTRVAPDGQAALRAHFPTVEVNPLGRTVLLRAATAPADRVAGDLSSTARPATRTVAVVTAGTSDLPVAEECAVTLDAIGHRVARVTDVGVAGIHRILARRETLADAAVVIVIAGMDGALPSVVGGLVRAPVIAVPTSVGYGSAFGGLAPLLTMLNSCAAGVTVCNIDNGFGAAVAASRILHATRGA
ncbi:MAG: nickel pincer cofactor biosynthesis protein LarB [Gemmatimonadetes bacterium]|nr:nickel pincer cofactor biosynthesis protein LarB [Gemmatimonadota bacterium]